MRKRSFTLVEVIISSAIITITALAVYSSMLSSRDTVISARFKEHAASLIIEKLDQMVKSEYRKLDEFATKYPSGKVESIPSSIWGKAGIDYSPKLSTARIKTAVYRYSNSCKIESVLFIPDEDEESDEGEAGAPVNLFAYHLYKYDCRRK